MKKEGQDPAMAAVLAAEQHLARLGVTVRRIDFAVLTEEEAARARLSLGPTAEQRAFASGGEAAIRRVRALLLQLAKDANQEVGRRDRESRDPDQDPELREAVGRFQALMMAWQVVGRLVGSAGPR